MLLTSATAIVYAWVLVSGASYSTASQIELFAAFGTEQACRTVAYDFVDSHPSKDFYCKPLRVFDRWPPRE